MGRSHTQPWRRSRSPPTTSAIVWGQLCTARPEAMEAVLSRTLNDRRFWVWPNDHLTSPRWR